MSNTNDISPNAQRLREWVHGRFGVWITHATAMRVLSFILWGPAK